MIKVDNTDDLFDLIAQDLKEFIRLFNPYISINKKLYNLLLNQDGQIRLKLYSVFADRYQIILASLLEFICLSLENYQLEIFIEEAKSDSENNLALYWFDSATTFPLLQINTDEISLEYNDYLESLQIGILDIIKMNTKNYGNK